MKERRNFLIGVALSTLLGWTIGFLGIPYIGKNFAFGMGFLACISLILLAWLVLIVWKKNIQFSQLLANDSPVSSLKASKTYALLWLVIALFIVFGGLISSVLLFRQKSYLKEQLEDQKHYILQQSELMQTTQRSNQFILISHLFDKIDAELAENSDRVLSEETIERIAALNYGFKPHRYLEGGRLSNEKLSPERGQLLLILSKVAMDTSSFERIKQKVSFSGADLRKANLSGIDLSGIDLKEANLREANLSQANLSQANLEFANLWGINLVKANLEEAVLNNTNLQWADLKEANAVKANMRGANLSDAKLRNTDLDSVNLSWSKLNGAFLNRANLPGANLTGAELGRANLSQTNFQGASLRLANLSEANLDKAILTDVTIAKATVEEKNWYEKLEQWEVEGLKEIRDKFKIAEDYAGQYNYRLLPIEE